MASAWDDDWETTADKPESTRPDPVRSTAPEPKISRAQRKILHQEANRQLWQAADTPKDTPIFIQARNVPPPLASATPVKQAVKVLARRPAPAQASAQSQANRQNGAQATVDDEPDSEEEERLKNAAAFAERQARAAREREEKQKKYAEVRERLFGADSQSTTASPKAQGQSISRPGSSGPNHSSRNSSSGRGRGGTNRHAREGSKQLYDPDSSPKPDSIFLQRREGTRTPLADSQKPIREPRGPDSTGRGFAPRNKASSRAALAGT